VDTVERLTLEAADAHSLIAVEHIHRYDLAAELLAGLRVADVGCGSGYGSRILRGACPSVTGIDNDTATIEGARATVGRGADVRFEVADANEFLRHDLSGDFDGVVLFESLEHLGDTEEALASLRGHAERGLRIVFSVPNSKGFAEENPFHETEFGYEEALSACKGFADSTMLFQFLAEGSLIRRAEPGETAGRVVATERGEPEYANHFVVCINLAAELGRLPDWAKMHLEAAPLYNSYMRILEQANRELRKTNARLARSKWAKADSAASTMLGKLELERRGLRKLRLEQSYDPDDPTERQAHLRRIEELHEQALQLDRTVQQMMSTRAWKVATQYRATRNKIAVALRLPGKRPKN
jgi:2-polyprenyl-3-methyl-5-hydroxy-6-metoxy-1,4-benzoquinol methylase